MLHTGKMAWGQCTRQCLHFYSAVGISQVHVEGKERRNTQYKTLVSCNYYSHACTQVYQYAHLSTLAQYPTDTSKLLTFAIQYNFECLDSISIDFNIHINPLIADTLLFHNIIVDTNFGPMEPR